MPASNSEARKRHEEAKVEPGDIIVFSGTPHMIASVDELNGFGDPIARAADGWGITLDSDGTFNCPQPNDRWCHIPAGTQS